MYVSKCHIANMKHFASHAVVLIVGKTVDKIIAAAADA